jgi:large subunit ribosomal protein L23
MGLFSNKKNKGHKEADVKSSVKVEDNNSKETIDSGKKSMKELYSDSGAKGKEDKKKEKRYGQAYSVLFRPLVTEKVSNLSAENKYVFEVAITANKIEVAKAIEEVYGIKPVKVNVVKMIGKNTRYGRVAGKKKNWKKAIVSLPEGKTIKVYEGV